MSQERGKGVWPGTQWHSRAFDTLYLRVQQVLFLDGAAMQPPLGQRLKARPAEGRCHGARARQIHLDELLQQVVLPHPTTARVFLLVLVARREGLVES